MTAAEQFVSAAYLVVLGVLLFYLVIHVAKVARLERAIEKLRRES